MDITILNQHIMKIIVTTRKEDSIRAISKRISLSYGWTHRWANELIELGVFKRVNNKIFLQTGNNFYRKAIKFIRETFNGNISFYYNLLNLFGIKYCFTGIDAVFIWTEGGYNISRYRNYYPIFIKIKKSDRKIFEFYKKKLSLKGKIFYKPVFLEDFAVSYHKEMPVDSLNETINFMKKYIYNFEPALEIIQEMYKKRFGVKYKEAITNV